MTAPLLRRCRPCSAALLFLLTGALLTFLSGCASDSGGAITTSRSGALPSDTAAPTSPAGTPMMGAGAGSSMGSNGLGGGRGSF